MKKGTGCVLCLVRRDWEGLGKTGTRDELNSESERDYKGRMD